MNKNILICGVGGQGTVLASRIIAAAAMEKTAAEAGVCIVAGDTKVAGRGQVDGVFITTTAVGRIMDGVTTGGALAKPGDSVIVTGDIGRHGCTILLARDDYGIEADVTSDCAPLWNAVRNVLTEVPGVHVIRDATRGGVGPRAPLPGLRGPPGHHHTPGDPGQSSRHPPQQPSHRRRRLHRNRHRGPPRPRRPPDRDRRPDHPAPARK